MAQSTPPLPNRIRALRKRAGMTQAELGNMVGQHQTQIGNFETGKRPLTFQHARDIADALGVSLADLLADEDCPCRPSEREKSLLIAFHQGDPERQEMIERVVPPLAS